MYFNVIHDMLHVPASRNVREVRPESLTSNGLSHSSVDTVAVAVVLRHDTGSGLPVQSLMLYSRAPFILRFSAFYFLVLYSKVSGPMFLKFCMDQPNL